MILPAHAARTTALLLALLVLSGCAVGPDYHQPAIAVPAAFKEAQGWKLAQPQDEALRGTWWELYGDTQLNALVEQVTVSNQNVHVAEAQYRQALAVLARSRAAYFPTLSASASAGRAQSGGSVVVTPADLVALNASWEADVWGSIRRSVESSSASAQASAADLQAALLSIQATLVQTYLQLRINDAQSRLLDQTAAAYQRTLQLTRNRYDTGVVGDLDVSEAETQLKSTQAQAIDLGEQRGQLEHAIALLVGKAPADFTLAPTYVLPALPSIPIDIPSTLLERRPDVAAAERRAAAANAQIGVAQAAFFPTLMLGASGGFQSSSWSNLFSLPNRFWSLGPSLAMTLFDGGAHSAQKEQAIAIYDQNVATYRQTVLTAFQSVEDSLVSLRVLAREETMQLEAARSAHDSLSLTSEQYQAGTVSYLNVVTAQVAALGADLGSLNIAGRRLLSSTALLKALGGGWRSPSQDTYLRDQSAR
ncbi:MAG: efflux transporter outer membrane subunit [Gallionellaceae bacterium]